MRLTSFEAFDEPWKEYVFSSHRIRCHDQPADIRY